MSTKAVKTILFLLCGYFNMTREKALKISNLLTRIESYEALIEEVRGLNGLEEISDCFGDTDTEDALVNIVQVKLDVLLKELAAMDDIPAERWMISLQSVQERRTTNEKRYI